MKNCPTCHGSFSDEMEFCPRDGSRLNAGPFETEEQLASGLARRFRIIRRLGKGGMGTVFLAEQIGVGNRPVALKVLNRRLLDDLDFLMRFQNEAASTGRIHHINVVTIYESAQADDGTPYIAMEFLEGESLRDALKKRGALPVADCAEILQQAARGLNSAHKLGIIHRDLKPDNIFLTTGEEGEIIIKIVDFGIAKLRESATHTLTGTVLGTPAYMSYEQASGMKSDDLDARSDVYSLGVVVYEMLTGRVPFHSDTPVGYLRKHLLEDPPPFQAVAPGFPVPSRVESVVMKALAKNRENRYPSAMQFAREFAMASSPLTSFEVPSATTTVESPNRAQADQERRHREDIQVKRPEKEKAEAESPAGQKAERERPARDQQEVERCEKEEAEAEKSAREKAEQKQRTPEQERAGRGAGREANVKSSAGEKNEQERPVREQKTTARREFGEATAAPLRQRRVKYFIFGLVGLALAGSSWYVVRQLKGYQRQRLADFWKPGLAVGEVRVNPKDRLNYVWVPPGSFQMGCSPHDPRCEKDEKPIHPVTITKGFWMGQTKVSVAAYKNFAVVTKRDMPDEPSFNYSNWAQVTPITLISWDDAQAYCGWLGGRLPTEAEWEYAALGGTSDSGPAHPGDAPVKNAGNEQISQKLANGYGLQNMLEEKYECVNDWYDPDYYQFSPLQDPAGPATGYWRGQRGGFWGKRLKEPRVSSRNQYDTGTRSGIQSFRCVGNETSFNAAGAAVERASPQVTVEMPKRNGSAPGARALRKNPKDELQYVWIPPGTFQMGCSKQDNQCVSGEEPSHPVTISKGFWINQTEVTVRAYKHFQDATKTLNGAWNKQDWASDDMPVVNATWDNAHDYCAWVGGRLPTEAEWEYAARGGSSEPRYGSINDVGWYVANSGNQPHNVALKRPNGFGLFDMLGNAWEWTNDWYKEDYYHESPSRDPTGPANWIEERVLRGGSWGYPEGYARASYRGRFAHGINREDIGFRCATDEVKP